MPQTPRVLHVMWQMTIGGAERAVYQLVREQRRRGLEADAVVAHELGLYGEQARETGARVYELGCRSALDVRRSWRLTALSREYEIGHHHGIEPLLIAASARARSPRLVYTHRGGVREHGWKKRARLRFARRYLRRFEAVSANTRQSAQVLARYLGMSERDVPVVYNGLDFQLLEPRRPRQEALAELPSWGPDVFLVGTAATLLPLKRVHLLLEALAVGGERRVHCVVLGDGPARPYLEERAAALGVAGRIAFLGRRDHIGDYLQLLDAFVLPSGPQESFGNAAVEAMAIGIPTVVFEDGGGLTEHVINRVTGIVVRDVAGLADGLAELARDPGLRQRLGGGARESVRAKYSLDRMVGRYDELYANALAARL